MDKLPVELLNMILLHLLPKEMTRLSMCNNRLWNLLKEDTILAKTNWNKYHTQILHGNLHEEWKLLSSIVHDPVEVAPFVDEIIFYGNYGHLSPVAYQNAWNLWDSHDLSLKARMESVLLPIVRDNPYLQSPLDFEEERTSYFDDDPDVLELYETNILQEAVQRGFSDVAIAQLLTLSPNLTKLELHIHDSRSDRMLLTFLKRLNAECVAKADVVSESLLWPPYPLQNLQEVRVHNGINGSGMIWLHSFSQLPSVKTITGFNMGIDWDNDAYIYRNDRILMSNVTTLELHSSQCSAPAIGRLVRDFNALETFKFAGRDITSHCVHIYSVHVYSVNLGRGIIKTLLQHAAKSLTQIQLQGERNDVGKSNPLSYTLRGFEKLIWLECSWYDIVPTPENRTAEFSLSKTLPQTLNYLRLHNCPQEETDVVVEWIKEIRDTHMNLRFIDWHPIST